MKIISTKEYNELKETQSAYLDLLIKPLQGVFEKVTDDDLLRENALVYAENKKLHSIIKEVREYIEKELGNINTNENILAKGICLKIKEILDKVGDEK